MSRMPLPMPRLAGFWVDTAVPLPLNQWTHLALTYDNGTVRIYSNGALAHTGAHTGPIAISTFATVIYASAGGKMAISSSRETGCHRHLQSSLERTEVGNSYSLVTRAVMELPLMHRSLHGEPTIPMLIRAVVTHWPKKAWAMRKVSQVEPSSSTESMIRYPYRCGSIQVHNQLSIEAWIYPTGPG